MALHVYDEVPKHLMNGRLNFETQQVTGRLLRLDFEASVIGNASSVSKSFAQYVSQFTVSSFLDWAIPSILPVVVTPTVVDTAGLITVNIPPMEWENATTTEPDIFGVLLYRDTGVTTTSPVIAIDFFGAVTLEQGYKFTYRQADDGLLRFLIP